MNEMWLKSCRLESDLYRIEPKAEPQRREQAIPAPTTTPARTEPGAYTPPNTRSREFTSSSSGLSDLGSFPAYSDSRIPPTRRENNSSGATKSTSLNYQSDFPPLPPANGRGSTTTPTPIWPSTTASYGASTTRQRRMQQESSNASDNRVSLFLGGPTAAGLGYDSFTRPPPRTSPESDWNAPVGVPNYFADNLETTEKSKGDSL